MKKFELGVCFGVPSFVSCGVPPPYFSYSSCLFVRCFFWGAHVCLVHVTNRVGLSSFVIKGNDVPY